MRVSRAQIERREEVVAKEKYSSNFMELNSKDKVAVHNTVLRELGLRQRFKFKCTECGNMFEEDVEGDGIEVFIGIQSETNSEVLDSLCVSCKKEQERKADNKLLGFDEDKWK